MSEDDSTNARVADSPSSITLIYARAKSGDEAAATELWNAYAKRLLGLARAVLRSRGIAPADASEDSVVNAAFTKFFDALSKRKYQGVADRHDIWRLLAVITRNHALNQARKHGKRLDRNLDSDSLFLSEPNFEPSSQEVVAVSDMIDRIHQEVRSRAKSEEQAMRITRVMTMTLSGHTQKEIASAIDQSEVTVRRNLRMIRQILKRKLREEGFGKQI